MTDKHPQAVDSASAGVRPTALLDGVGRATWQAFNAMQATKTRHFELLEALDARRERYRITPSAADRHRLDCLLADHDAEVKRFRSASDALRDTDPEAHRRLFEYIGFVNGALDSRSTH